MIARGTIQIGGHWLFAQSIILQFEKFAENLAIKSQAEKLDNVQINWKGLKVETAL